MSDFQRELIYYNSLRDLEWDGDGFLINPGPTEGNAWDARNFRDIVLTLVGTGNVKAYGSAQKLPPDFSQTSTLANSWTPISLVDYSLVGTGAFFAGATGVSVSNATKLAELDTNGLTWFAIKRSVDTVEVLATIFTAQ